MKILDIVLSEKVLGPILSIVIGFVVYKIIRSLIKKIFSLRSRRVDENKVKMISDLVTNIVKYFIIVIVFLIILEIYGVDTKALIASLGVVGLVAGLAVQDTLKDFIAGITIIVENQYEIGDWVKINNFKGEIVSLGMKTTRLKAYTGEIMILPNHLIQEVINYSQSSSLALVDISISYESDIDKAIEVLNKMCEKLSKENKSITSDLQVLGVQNLGNSSVDIRIVGETKPTENFGVEREIKKQAKMILDKNKISIPYPQMVVHDGKRV